MSDRTYRVVRTETIYYHGEFTEQELLDMGAAPEIFTEFDGDAILSELDDEANDNGAFRIALEARTEDNGNVGGNVFEFTGSDG